MPGHGLHARNTEINEGPVFPSQCSQSSGGSIIQGENKGHGRIKGYETVRLQVGRNAGSGTPSPPEEHHSSMGTSQMLGGPGTQRYLGMVQVYSIHGKLLGVLQEVDFCFSWGHAPNGKKGITGGHGKSPPESYCLKVATVRTCDSGKANVLECVYG